VIKINLDTKNDIEQDNTGRSQNDTQITFFNIKVSQWFTKQSKTWLIKNSMIQNFTLFRILVWTYVPRKNSELTRFYCIKQPPTPIYFIMTCGKKISKAFKTNYSLTKKWLKNMLMHSQCIHISKTLDCTQNNVHFNHLQYLDHVIPDTPKLL
jgi:hypothetical protein